MDTEVPTNELVVRAQAGDAKAFEELARRYRDRLEARVRSRIGRRLRTRLEAEDVLQETFAVALESIGKFRPQGEDSFFRWLASIAEHLLWSSSQKKAWDQIRLSRDVPGSAASPSRSLRREERLERLEKALGELREDYRKALEMARLEGLTVNEIARRMNRSPEAVKKLVARALLRLRETFGDTESLHLPDREIERAGGNHGR